MSRSNLNENRAANPATRWFEWNGEHGVVRYYDEDSKKNVDVGNDFTFMLLDELKTVRGWHEASKSGIYANEVKNTREEVLVVKAFKHGVLAEGIYKDIKDRVNAAGGKFNANLYIAFKSDNGLEIGSLRLKGAALGAWMEFEKQHRNELYKKAIRIKGSTQGKTGRVVFHVPAFHVTEITEQTNAAATALDKSLQEFLAAYLKRNKRDQAEVVAAHLSDEQIAAESHHHDDSELMDSDIPF